MKKSVRRNTGSILTRRYNPSTEIKYQKMDRVVHGLRTLKQLFGSP